MNNVFEMEWFELNENAKKVLLLIMRRGIVPIEFTSASVISMNLDSFVGVSIKINCRSINNSRDRIQNYNIENINSASFNKKK